MRRTNLPMLALVICLGILVGIIMNACQPPPSMMRPVVVTVVPVTPGTGRESIAAFLGGDVCVVNGEARIMDITKSDDSTLWTVLYQRKNGDTINRYFYRDGVDPSTWYERGFTVLDTEGACP